MCDLACETEPEPRVLKTRIDESIDWLLIVDIDMGVLPPAPLLGSWNVDVRVGVHDHATVRLDEPYPLVSLSCVVMEPVPRAGRVASPMLCEVVDLGPTAGAHRSDYNPEHPINMALGIRQPEDGPPGRTADDPPFDVEGTTNGLEVLYVTVHVDGGPVHVIVCCVGCASSGGALVVADDPMEPAIEQFESAGSKP